MYWKDLSPSAHPRNTEDPSPEAEGREREGEWRRHCLWVTNTETSLPVGYEYKEVTARGLRIQRRHCPWVTNTETSLPVRFAHTDVTALFSLFWLCFLKRTKDALLENDLREIIAVLSSECLVWWLLPLGLYYSLQHAECFAKQQHCVLIIRWKIGKFVFNRQISLHENHETCL